MSKLLRANFRRLFQSKLFRVCMIGLFCLGIFFTLARYFDIQANPEYYAGKPDDFKCAEGFAFSGAFHIMFVVAIVIGSFVGTEYSDGTIRNKVVVGHRKGTIYLAGLIACMEASILLLLVELVGIFLVGKMVFTVSIMSAGEILSYAFCECISMIALSAILVFLAMLIPNKAAGSVTVLLTVMLLFMMAMTVDDRLHQPEYRNSHEITMVFVDGETGEAIPMPEPAKEKNPRYPEGMKRAVYEFLYDFVPVCQFMQAVRENSDKIPVMMGYSLLLCVIATAGGVWLFCKKDLT